MASIAFYGDSSGQEVFAIDVTSMSLVARILTGLGPYPVDAVGLRHVLASTRLESSVTPIDIASLCALPKIELSHKPRSSSTNASGLILVSGADKPVSTVIDSKTWEIVGGPFGDPMHGSIDDFGGQLASGHERWLSDSDRFFLIDRIRRKIHLFRHTTGERIWSCNTPTSCHHLTPDTDGSGSYFALCEGNPLSKLPPSIMKLAPHGESFIIDTHTFLPIAPSLIDRTGSHHVDINGDKLYVGSNEGVTYVLCRRDLSLLTQIATGVGSGHTGFINDSGQEIGISINHTEQFITLFDSKSDTFIRNIQVSSAASSGGRRTQGHTSGKRGKFFYMMASLDATFLEIDVLSGDITRQLVIPPKDASGALPYPMQGVFVWDSPGNSCTQCC